MLLCTKSEARAAGLKHYFTGVPCKRGHIAPRFLEGSCTECRAAQSSAWYADKERSRQKTAKWRAANPERETANRRAWQAANPDKMAKYDADYAARNPGAKAEASRRWYYRNQEQQQKRAVEYRNANIEDARRKSSAYNKANPEKIAAIARNRRARAKASGGKHTDADIAAILDLQKGRCAYCRIKFGKYQVDHIIPLARGGSNDRTNLQALCTPCNQAKSAKDPIVFAQSLGMLL